MESSVVQRLKEMVEWLQKEYAGIRTGQASPLLLDNIKVESYGSYMKLNQVGSVSVEDARTLRVSVWDKQTLTAVEKAIRDADLGVSTVTDSSGLRVIFPDLTSERRTQLMKLAKAKLEESRVSVRSVRDDFMKLIEKQQKDAEISEDQKFTFKEMIQRHVDKTNQSLEGLFIQKESELQK